MFFPKKERAILAESRLPTSRPHRWWLVLAALPMLGVVAAFGIAPGSLPDNVERRTIVQELPLALGSLAPESDTPPMYYREERIQRGDTLGSILTRLAIDDPDAIDQLRSAPESRAFYQLVPGRTVKAVTTDEGRLLSLKYVTPDGQEFYALRSGQDDLTIDQRPLSLHPQLMMGSGLIRYSLFQAIDDAGLDEEIAIQIAEILSSEIDFHRDLRPGARFSVVYEALYHGGEFIRAGRVVAVEFVNDGRSVRAVSFTDGNSQSAFYSEEGKSLRKTFLRSPIEFSRITSGFSSARFHPVLARWRAHRGVDYGAPQGTRIRATADGIVRLAGIMNGYGNVVVLHHPNGFETLYGHLSGFARGLRAGDRVSQNDVIGYVGMTGLATGPHLHYELRVDGVHRNPIKVATPPAPSISPSNQQAFLSATRPLLERLDLIKEANIAALQ